MSLQTPTRKLRDKIVTRRYLEPNDILIPHTHDFYFNGIDAYITLGNFTLPNNFIFETSYRKLVKYYASGFEWMVIKKSDVWHGVFSLTLESIIRHYYRLEDENGTLHQLIYEYSENNNDTDNYHKIKLVKDNSGMKFYFDDVLRISNSDVFNIKQSDEDFVIGKHGGGSHYPFRIQYIKITNLDSNKTVLFLDATAYSGYSHNYIDLSGYGNNGTPYNVKRVNADHKWLWQIKNFATDDKLHFSFFPDNTKIKIYNNKREYNITAHYYITIPIEIEPDYYTIEVKLP